jgi:hypothetical protein
MKGNNGSFMQFTSIHPVIQPYVLAAGLVVLLGSGTPTFAQVSRPNLTPYRPSGWTGKVVVSRTTGTMADSTGLTSGDTLYVDWAVINNGAAATGARFYTALYVDGVSKQAWYADPAVNPGAIRQVTDYSIGSLSAGTHTIRIKTDSTGAIAESNEADNEYTKTITIVLPDWAPASLNGKILELSDGVSKLCFGPNNSVAIDLPVAEGHYSYTKLGAKSASLSLTLTAPSYNAGGLSISATFTSAGGGSYFMRRAADGRTFNGLFTISDQANSARASVNNIQVTMHDALNGVFYVNLFTSTFTTSNGGAGTYTYSGVGPACGLVHLNFSTPTAYAGRRGYVVLIFSNNADGHYGIAYPAVQGAPQNSSTGWFTVP